MTNKEKLYSIPLALLVLFFLIFSLSVVLAGTETRWNTEDGIYSKYAMNATYTFTNPGMYNVTLKVTNEAGNSTVTKPNCITVTFPQAPVADSATRNNTIVYCFWPNWPYLGSYQPDWNTLTHVSYSEWNLNSDGTLTDPGNISNYYAVRDQVHQHGVKITLCIHTSDPYVIDSVIANHQTDFINNISNSLQIYGADGVNLDLETPTDINSITGTSNVPLFENLMANLHTTLKAANPAYHISLDTPRGINYVATFKNANLKKYVDSVFLMSYDYCNRKTTAPNSPYDSPIRYDAIDLVNDTSKYFSKDQIILGLPFYGYDYSTDSDQPGANITNEKVVHIEDAISNSQIYGRIWDSDSNTPWYYYKSGDTWHQVWYDDDESLRLKYRYAKSENLGGVGFWALGYEGNYSNIWKVFQFDPVADFNISVTSGHAPLDVQFTDLSQHATLRNWDFGDGTTSIEQNPLHTYYAAGTYIVNLTTGNGNNTTSKTATITVFEESSSSGGGGAGGSPEPVKNVEVKELSQAFVTNGKPVKFDFPKNATCAVYVSFDAKKTFGKTTTIAELLKGKSSLISELPEGEVYKSFNIWVGNGGIATSKNIENPVVCFKVEKAWIQDKKIEQDSITLNRYSNKKWDQFPVSLSSKDDKFLYFTAKTSGFSSFVITGTAKPSEETVTGIQLASNETINENNTENKEPQKEQKEILKTPGFEVYYGIDGLLAVFLYKRKSNCGRPPYLKR